MGKVVWGEEQTTSKKGKVVWAEGEATKKGIRESLSPTVKSLVDDAKTIGGGAIGGFKAGVDFLAQIPGIAIAGLQTVAEAPGVGAAILTDKLSGSGAEGQDYWDEYVANASNRINTTLDKFTPSKYLDKPSPEEQGGYNIAHKVLGLPAEAGIQATRGLIAGSSLLMPSSKSFDEKLNQAGDWLQNPEQQPALSAATDAVGTLWGYGMASGVPGSIRQRWRGTDGPNKMSRKPMRDKQEPSMGPETKEYYDTLAAEETIRQGEPYTVDGKTWYAPDQGGKPDPKIGEVDQYLKPEEAKILELDSKGRRDPTGRPLDETILTEGEKKAKAFVEETRIKTAEEARKKSVAAWERDPRTQEGTTADMFAKEDAFKAEKERIETERAKIRQQIWSKELEPILGEKGETIGWKDKEGKEYTNEQLIDAFNKDLPFETMAVEPSSPRFKPTEQESVIDLVPGGKKGKKGKVNWEPKTEERLAKEGKERAPAGMPEFPGTQEFSARFPRNELEFDPPRAESAVQRAQVDPLIGRMTSQIEFQNKLMGEINTKLSEVLQDLAKAKIGKKGTKALRDEYAALKTQLAKEQERVQQLQAESEARQAELQQQAPPPQQIQKSQQFDLGQPPQGGGGKPVEKTPTFDLHRETPKETPNYGNEFEIRRAEVDQRSIDTIMESVNKGDSPVTTMDYAARNDFQGMLESVAKTSKDPFNASIAKKLANKNLRDVGVELRAGSALESHPDSVGGYSGSKNLVTLTPHGAMNNHTILHEGVHAAVNNLMLTQPNHPRVKAINELFEYTRNFIDPSKHYGMTNPLEFAAEGFSNRAFQEALKNIKINKILVDKLGLRELGRAITNAWDAFVQVVAKYLGLKPGEVNALSVLLNEGSRLIDQTTPYMRNKGVAQSSAMAAPKQNKKGVVKTVTGISLLDTRPAKDVVAEAKELGQIKDIPEHRSIAYGEVLQGRDVANWANKYNPFVSWFVDKVTSADRLYRMKAVEAIKGDQWDPGRRWDKRRRKDFTGATTFLRDFNTPTQSKDFVSKALWDFDSMGKDATRQDLQQLGMDPKEVQAFGATQKRLADFLAEFNSTAMQSGFAPMAVRPGFMPHIRLGEYMVYVKSATQGKLNAIPVENIYQANKLKQDLAQQFPQHLVEWERMHKSRYDINDLSPYFEILSQLNTKSPDYVIINKAAQDILIHRGFAKHGLFRQGIPGYLGPKGYKETATAIETYLEKGYRFLANQKKNAEFQDFMKALEANGINKNQIPNTIAYMEKYRENSTGSLKNYASAIDNVLEFAGENTGKLNIGSPSSARKSLSTLNGLASAFLLGTGKFMMIQPFQTGFAIPKMLETGRSLGMSTGEVFARTPAAFFMGLKNLITSSPEARAGMNYAKRNGHVDSKIVDFMDTNLKDNTTSKVANTISQSTHWTLGKWEQETVRAPAFMMYDYMFRDVITDNATRWDLAGKLTDHTMVDYSRNEKPFAYGHLGLAGDAAAPLKTYTHSYFGHALNYINKAKEGDVAPLAAFVGVQAAIAGITGMLGIELADEIIDKINLVSDSNIPNVEQWLYESGQGDLVTFGGVSTMTGINVSGSLSAPSPSGFISAPGVEFAGNAIAQSSGWLRKTISGTATRPDEMLALQSVAPTSFQGMIEQAYTQPGLGPPNPRNNMLPDLPERTTGLSQPDNFMYPSDTAARHLGGRSLKEARSMQTIKMDKHHQAKYSKKRGEIEKALVESMIEGDDRTDKLFERWVKFGGDPRGVADMLKRRLKAQNLNYAERTLTKMKIKSEEKIKRLENLSREMDRLEEYQLIELARELKKDE